MTLENYNWEKKKTNQSGYAARYVTHDIVNKSPVIDQFRGSQVSMHKPNTLNYNGEEVTLDFEINDRWAMVYVDQAFLDQMNGEDFSDVILNFLEPGQQRGLEDY